LIDVRRWPGTLIDDRRHGNGSSHKASMPPPSVRNVVVLFEFQTPLILLLEGAGIARKNTRWLQRALRGALVFHDAEQLG